LFCNEHKIDNYRLISGKFKEYEYYWNRFKEDLKDKIFVLSDICGKTWKEVDEILRNLIEKPDVIFIDHINHIKTQGGKEKESIDEYLINMQALAIEHNVSIVIVAQINRTALDAKNPIPELHQLKGSGCLEEICGVAILLHWEWKYDNNKPREVYKVIVAKNRNGRTGFVEMRFEPEYYKFSKYEKPKEPQVKKKSKFQQVELSEVQSEVQPEVAWDE
jgi:replicative DNA helicase